MPKKFTFPKWLERTPDELKEEARVQELRRASFGRGHLTPEELLIGRGALLEETARGNLAAGDKEVSKGQLAEGLAMQGRFAEAATTHPEKHARKQFRRIAKAIDRSDADKCHCGDIKGEVDGVEVSITPRFVEREVFSKKHGKVVPVIVCVKCGHANAREAKSRLLLPKVNQNLAAAKNDGRGMIRDSQILKA